MANRLSCASINCQPWSVWVIRGMLERCKPDPRSILAVCQVGQLLYEDNFIYLTLFSTIFLAESAPSGSLISRENFKGCIRHVSIRNERRDWIEMEDLRNVLLSECLVSSDESWRSMSEIRTAFRAHLVPVDATPKLFPNVLWSITSLEPPIYSPSLPYKLGYCRISFECLYN